jgi:hypothetical protein
VPAVSLRGVMMIILLHIVKALRMAELHGVVIN